MGKEKTQNRYSQLLEAIFFKHYQDGASEVSFERMDIQDAAKILKIEEPKNFGDILYSFRYRTELPMRIQEKSPIGKKWIIRPAGKGKYRFVAVSEANIIPAKILIETKILDSTPGIISKYTLNDEQALLAKLRYNRLIDIFTGLTCYSLQSHLRTTLKDGSQVETDEIYLGLDKRGAHYILPVQAKGGKDKIGIVQIEQDFDMCAMKFPDLECRSIALQFIEDEIIALFEFEKIEDSIKVASERHYRLVKAAELSQEEIRVYQSRPQ